MNAAFLLMSSALLSGYQEKAPPLPPSPPAAMTTIVAAPTVGCGGGCGDVCGAGSPSGCSDANPMAKTGILARLKSPFKRLGKSDDCGCGSAPVFTGFTTAACDTCGSNAGHQGLLAKLKAKFHHTESASYSDSCATGGCASGGCASGGCALPPVPGAPLLMVPATPPKEMEKPKVPLKEGGTLKEATPKINAPALTPVAVPAIPVGPLLSGSKSAY